VPSDSPNSSLKPQGSTRAWRRVRESIPKSCSRCGRSNSEARAAGHGELELSHKTPRRDGGGDAPSNLEWVCEREQNQGRPKGS
jgi:5-methylcytosine-specific restriction endonuclease McrA